MACIGQRCFSPIACSAFEYCRQLNIRYGMPNDATAAEWRAKFGIQPDPEAAGLVADAAVLLEQHGDYLLGDL